MEAAAEGLAMAGRLAGHRHVLVPAGIAQDAHGALLVAHAQHAPAAHRLGEEIARTGDLTLGAERQPALAEDGALLSLEGVTLSVIGLLYTNTPLCRSNLTD